MAIQYFGKGGVLPSLIVVLALLSLAVTVSAQLPEDTPIPESDCKKINAETNLTCEAPPAHGDDILRNLPYNENVYAKCVETRCLCVNKTYTIGNGISCAALKTGEGLFSESSVITCNRMVECYQKFWMCVTSALMTRNANSKAKPAAKALPADAQAFILDGGSPDNNDAISVPATSNAVSFAATPTVLTSAETKAVEVMIRDGRTPGLPFSSTTTYASCKALMCEAAYSRLNCRLATCMPNYTQCFQYLRPPPLPFRHQLCTQGCRAALVMMALTIVFVTSALICCCACPQRVKVIEPLVTADGSDDKRSS